MAQNRIGTVWFAGAGASRACGHVVTNEILPGILDRLEQQRFGDEQVDAHAPELRRFFARMLPGDRKKGLPLITEILSVIDHCIASGEELISADVCTMTLAQTRWLLERAMTTVINAKVHAPDVKPGEISGWLEQREQRQDARVAVLSTNYDASLDGALLRGFLPDWNEDYARTDFGFSWRDADGGLLVHPSADPLLRLYKLHGSLNWLGCNRCGYIYVNFFGSIVQLADGDGDWSRCHCGHEPLRAVLVAPSFVRQVRDRSLLAVWRSAGEALRLADEWVFAGYSLPSEDIGVRALLLRALFSRDKPPKVTVVSNDTRAEPGYRLLFPDCSYTPSGLRSFLDGQASWR